MIGLDLKLVTDRLNDKEGAKLVKQEPKNFRPELDLQIK